MFRRSLYILLFVIIGSNLFSQNYNPFALDHGMWEVSRYGPTGPLYTSALAYYSWSLYQANGDTIIGSYTYKKVVAAYATTNKSGGQNYGPNSFMFAYRNDIPNKKVYIYAKPYSLNPDGFDMTGQYKDTLWYDFNLNVGDTLKSSYSMRGDVIDPGRVIVRSIDSVLICSVYHKRFHFCVAAPETDLIEGVGFADSFIQTTWACPFEPVYLYNTTFFCSLQSVKEESVLIKNIKVFPNPVQTTIEINYSDQKIILPVEYSIVDCLGKIVSKGISIDNKTIDVSKLQTGLYFIRIQDKQKNSFQGKFLKQ